MASHLDPDALADFREGLSGRRRSARIRAHLDACPTCASLDKDLAQVTELLASAPAPKMPDHLVARLESVLAAEAAARTAKQDLADRDTGAADSTDHSPRRTGRRSWQPRPAMLGVAAAIAAILAVGGYGLASLHQGAGNASSSAAGGPDLGSKGKALEPSATHLPANGAAIPGPSAQLRVIESRTDYTPGRLASQARALLTGHSIDASGNARRNASPQHQTPVAGPGVFSPLQSCVKVVTGGLSPLTVDEAYYQGRPATIIVLPPAPGRAGQVWVAGPACSATNPDLITHIRFTG